MIVVDVLPSLPAWSFVAQGREGLILYIIFSSKLYHSSCISSHPLGDVHVFHGGRK